MKCDKCGERVQNIGTIKGCDLCGNGFCERCSKELIHVAAFVDLCSDCTTRKEIKKDVQSIMEAERMSNESWKEKQRLSDKIRRFVHDAKESRVPILIRKTKTAKGGKK